MLENRGGKTFIDVTDNMGPDFTFAGYQRGSAFVDLNSDGFMDLVVTSLGQKLRILMNNALIRNQWIIFDLRGQKSNRDGIVATIKMNTGSIHCPIRRGLLGRLPLRPATNASLRCFTHPSQRQIRTSYPTPPV